MILIRFLKTLKNSYSWYSFLKDFWEMILAIIGIFGGIGMGIAWNVWIGGTIFVFSILALVFLLIGLFLGKRKYIDLLEAVILFDKFSGKSKEFIDFPFNTLHPFVLARLKQKNDYNQDINRIFLYILQQCKDEKIDLYGEKNPSIHKHKIYPYYINLMNFSGDFSKLYDNDMAEMFRKMSLKRKDIFKVVYKTYRCTHILPTK